MAASKCDEGPISTPAGAASGSRGSTDGFGGCSRRSTPNSALDRLGRGRRRSLSGLKRPNTHKDNSTDNCRLLVLNILLRTKVASDDVP